MSGVDIEQSLNRSELQIALEVYRMNIEQLIVTIINDRRESALVFIPPCSELQIAKSESSFKAKFGHPFPEPFKLVLSNSNGIKHNGLIIWPAMPQSIFQDTILQVNKNLRDSFSDRYIYFGQRDEELYTLNIESNEYCAIEYYGKSEWQKFSSADEMFKFILERAWD
jgi:hypothetical protein